MSSGHERGDGRESIGVRVFAALLRLLPLELRRAWGDEMASTFAAGSRHAAQRGFRTLVVFWVHEAIGLLVTALRARRRSVWVRRTQGWVASSAMGDEPQRARGVMGALSHLWADVQYSLRAFARRPAMMGLAVTSLALGIGASTAMFSVVDSVLLRPLPFEDPERIVSVYPTNPEWRGHPTMGDFADRGTISLPEFYWLSENATSFDGIGAYIGYGGPTLSRDGATPEQLTWVRATHGVLDALRVRPLRGRLFGAEDDPRNGARSVLLLERFWVTHFASAPDIVGETLRLNGTAYTVIGVLPDEVMQATSDADVWVLMAGTSSEGNWGNHNVSGVVARLADGVSLERARSEVARLFADVSAEHRHGHGGAIYPRLEDRTRRVRPALLALIAAAMVLLAVGCGNVAALQIGAGIDREQEIAVRSALGAGRQRLTRQFLTESLVLTAAGALAGLFVAVVLGRLLLFLAPPGVPRIEQAALDGRVLLFATGISTLAGIAFGMIPALHLSRADGSSTLRSSRGVTRGRGRLQAAVVAGELALATTLLVAAALLVRTLIALNQVDLGVDTAGLYEVRIAPQYQRFADEPDADARTQAIDGYFQQFVDAIEAIPGVAAVAVTDNVPLTGDRGNNTVEPEGWDAEAEGEELLAERRFVSANFFETTGIRIVEGRAFQAADNHPNAAPVMVLSEGLARRVWPNEPATGKRVSFWGRAPATVVGVAADLRDEDLATVTRYAFYVPVRQVSAQTGALLVRVEGDPTAPLAALRPRVASVDAEVPVTRIASFEELLSSAVSEQRFRARLMLAFALLAALFALLGVYGVTARFVARRTRELGIRAALGANRGDVVSLVLRQGIRLAGFGAIVGLAASTATTRYLEELLFGVRAMDPLSIVVIVLFVAGASIGASLSPAWRAARVAPLEALRTE